MPIVSNVKGNLINLALSGKYQAIAHGCNCYNTMGAGIAPQIAQAWVGAYEADQATVSGSVDKLGKYTMYHDTELDVIVFNLYTQYSFGSKPNTHDVDYPAIYHSFKLLNSLLPSINRNKENVDKRKVGIPLIGAGLAGGHWQAIQTLINLATPDIEMEVVEYDGS